MGTILPFVGGGIDLLWIKQLVPTWFEVKVRGMLGHDEKDNKEIIILGRTLRWTQDGLEYEADPTHRKMILEHFGLDSSCKSLKYNADKDTKKNNGNGSL